MAIGYTEKDFTINDLSDYFKNTPIIELKQIHSDKILIAGEVRGNPSGDGIVLDSRNTVGIIKTADCIPLFFWNKDCTIAGIIHCGWKGLQKRIEEKLIHILVKRQVRPETCLFYLGPGIEKTCYPVGPELIEHFQSHGYKNQVFIPRKGGGYDLDLKRALFLSLAALGIPPRNILDSEICTFCEAHRFPSFRREGKTNNRIYNFLILK